MAFQPIYPISNPIEKEITAEGVVTSAISIWGRSQQLKADSYGGKATIRYNGVLKHSFEDVREASPISPFQYDHNISQMVVIDGTIVWVTRASKVRNFCGFLSLISPALYEGYPCDLVFSVCKNSAYYTSVKVFVDGVEKALTNDGIFIVDANAIEQELRIEATNINGDKEIYKWNGVLCYILNTTELSNATYLINEPRNKDNLVNPFYVRWINAYGGYDYWMFTGKQFHSKVIGKLATYEKNDALGKQTILSKEANENISASTGIITKREAEAISHLLYSPEVKYYDTDKNEWVDIIVTTDNKLSWATDQPTGEIIMNFELPKPQIVK